jgi:hypothetical protein
MTRNCRKRCIGGLENEAEKLFGGALAPRLEKEFSVVFGGSLQEFDKMKTQDLV